MRSFAYQFLFLLASLTGWNTAACLAQRPTGPATLEGLLNSDEGQKPTAEADADPKRPAGTVARPKDGVQHPDLDKAWAVYDQAVANAAESIKAAILKLFDAATARGDLDAAEKWQAALKKFVKSGEVPAEAEIKPTVNATVSDYKKAKEELAETYDAVVKALTMEKKLAEAKAVRDEWLTSSQLGGTVARLVKPGSGLLGQYFAGTNLDPRRRVFARVDPVLAMDFKKNPVGQGVPNGNFSIRWSGFVSPEQTDSYVFTGYSDDGVRIAVNRKVILNEWGRWGRFQSAAVPMRAGTKYLIVIEYCAKGGPKDSFVLDWQGEKVVRERVPTRCLYPPESRD